MNFCAGTHSIRLNFFKQLADLLLRGAGGNDYNPPTISPTQGQSRISPWKPKHYSNLNQVYILQLSEIYE